MKFMPNRTRKLAVSAGATALAAILGLSVATAGPAAATVYIPGPQQTCSSGQPKLDYEYMENDNYNTLTWSNVCGVGTWGWADYQQGVWWLYAIRMPTSPYHRVWLHQNANGSGLTACFYSRNSDIYIQAYFNQYGTWIQTPGNVQVSSNTAPC
jgi:hypothetical protein